MSMLMNSCLTSYKELVDKNLKARIADFEYVLTAEDRMYAEEKETFFVDGNWYESFCEWLKDYAVAFVDMDGSSGERMELPCENPQDYFVLNDAGSIFYHSLDCSAKAEIELSGRDKEVMCRAYELGFYLHIQVLRRKQLDKWSITMRPTTPTLNG